MPLKYGQRSMREMVLVPGFEPGSTDRESVMMDRTTLHEQGCTQRNFAYQKHPPKKFLSLSLSVMRLDT